MPAEGLVEAAAEVLPKTDWQLIAQPLR